MPKLKAICFYLNDCDLKFEYFVRLGSWFRTRGYSVVYLLETPHILNKFPAVRDEIYFCQNNFAQSEPIRFDASEAMQWIYSDIDRHIWWGRSEMDLNEWQQTLNSIYLSLDSIRENYDLQAVVFEGLTMYSAFCIQDWARKNSSLFLGLSISRIPGRYEVQSSEQDFSDLLQEKFHGLCHGSIKLDTHQEQAISSYIQNIETIQPSYMKNSVLGLKNPFAFFMQTRTYSKVWASVKSTLKGYSSAQFGTPLMSDYTYFKRTLANVFRARVARRYYRNINEKEDFFLYPLHYHPEASTSVGAKYTDYEFNAIKNIAISLPWGIKLYVKEHISAEGIRPPRFYKDLERFPNIRLLAPTENTKKLIRDSLGIITLTSTVGYEALVLNRPVIVLGDVFYSINPNCFTVKDFYLLPATVKKALNSKIDDQANHDFVKAYWLACQEGSIFQKTAFSDVNLALVGEQLEQIIQAKRTLPALAVL